MNRSSSHKSNIHPQVKHITISTAMVVSRRPSGGGRLFSTFGLAGTTSAILIVASAFLLLNIGTVDAHGYLMSPRSRNFLAHSSQDGKGQYGGTATDPKVDYEPQSLNRGGLCGARSGVQYTFPANAVGGPMPLNIQATYEQGQEIILEAVLTAHHWGHIEVKACPLAQHGDAPTQECFDQFPLLFVEDLIYPNSPNDPDYPGRAYIPSPSAPGTTSAGNPSGTLFRQKFKLPSNLNGQIVLLQWYYRTGNSCSSPGYDKYFGVWGSPPSGLPTCPNPVDSCGNGAPEQFWNCAEITITNGPGESSTPTPPAGPAELPCSGETGPSGPMPPPGPAPTYAPPPPPGPSPTSPPPPPPPAPTAGQAESFRCGMSWIDANTKCGIPCPSGNSTVCQPTGEYCYANLGSQACTAPAPPTNSPPPPSPTSDVELVASGGARCGTSEVDAREMCGDTCTDASQCPSGTACYATHPNYCGDANFTPFQWINPVVSTAWARCGTSEVNARSFCKPACNSDADCPVSGENCYSVHQNYCGSQVAGGSRMLRGN